MLFKDAVWLALERYPDCRLRRAAWDKRLDAILSPDRHLQLRPSIDLTEQDAAADDWEVYDTKATGDQRRPTIRR